MNRLPKEVLCVIFQELHLLQKQECMLVCRQWSDIIRSKDLFSTVYISSTKMLRELTKILDENKPYRLQIRNLIIDGNVNLATNTQILLKYFPRVRFIHNEPLDFRWRYVSGEQPPNFIEWINQIENMETFSYPPDNNVLSLGVFLGLQKLVINCRYSSTPLSVPEIVSNAPNVKTLVIIKTSISLNDIESLLAGLTALRSLILEKLTPVPIHELNFNNTTNLLTTLCVDLEFPNKDIIIQWLQYITRTSNQLHHFKFTFPWKNNITSQQETEMTNNGFVPLLQLLGHQLKYIEINSSDEMLTVLNTLSTLNVEEKIVKINTLFRKSQILSVNQLGRLINQLTITVNDDITNKLYYLRYIKTLKKLKIECDRRNIHGRACLKTLLDNCSESLETLEVCDFDIDMHDTTSYPFQLKELAIHKGAISENLYTFISNSLPNLKHLTIDQQDYGCTYTISLGTKNLDRLDFSMNYNGFIMVATLSDHQTRCYSLSTYKVPEFQPVEINENQMQRPITRIPLDQVEGSRSFVRLTCNSVKYLTINNRIAF